MRRALRILSISLITAGLVVLADVGLTLAWQEPVSSIYGSIKQGQAADSLDKLESEFPTAADLRALDRVKGVEAKARLLAERFADRVETGQGIGRIRIPSIGVDIVLVQGTDTTTLQRGPGHYPETPFPGQGKTIGIAGHRTTYLAPFRHIDQIEPGDDILIEMPYAAFTYEVSKTDIVDPSDVGIVDDVGHERVVLTACHPLYSAAQRYAVFGELESVSLFAATGRRWLDP
ncbi:MAG TPA: sortase [Solirubrobacterales bacterium]|nr:sortase [Solirubrobacterales bacterium]